MKFITKDDDFGIRKTLFKLYGNRSKSDCIVTSAAKVEEIFNFWMNQFIPPAWYESKGTILRHIDEIKAIPYDPNWVWIKRGKQYTCAVITQQLMQQIRHKQVELPTYQEIEEEKQRWQSHPEYNKEEGFSQPLEEEFVQLVIRK